MRKGITSTLCQDARDGTVEIIGMREVAASVKKFGEREGMNMITLSIQANQQALLTYVAITPTRCPQNLSQLVMKICPFG
jgi:hypothetical protein